MTAGALAGLCAGVFAVASALTGYVRALALRHGLIDRPNARSSHQEPRARGGGLAMAVATIAGLAWLAAAGALPAAEFAGLAGAGALLTAVGFADDRGGVPRRIRLATHVSAAVAILVSLHGAPPVLPLTPVLASLLALIYVVWVINLTNFMDGIDGLAALEAITVCGGGVLLSRAAGVDAIAPAAVAAAAAAGFLVWNWPPARIFMGDAGSGFLGVTIAGLSLQAGHARPVLFWSWVILMAAFVSDATLTLIRRLARGERVVDAHRTHAYQHSAASRSHRAVTVVVGLINLLWLLPLALLVASARLPVPAGLLMAYVPLVVLAWRQGSGTPAAPAERSHPIG